MAGRHPRLKGRESEQTAADSGGQGILARCSPWGLRGDTTWHLNLNSNDNTLS